MGFEESRLIILRRMILKNVQYTPYGQDGEKIHRGIERERERENEREGEKMRERKRKGLRREIT